MVLKQLFSNALLNIIIDLFLKPTLNESKICMKKGQNESEKMSFDN